MQNNGKILKDALISRYKADYNEAMAMLTVYSSNAVGIGEHPQILGEMSKFVEKAASAKDCLEILNNKGGE